MDFFLQIARLTTFGKDRVWQKPHVSNSLFPTSNTKNWSYFSFSTTKTALSRAKQDDHQETPSRESNSPQ